MGIVSHRVSCHVSHTNHSHRKCDETKPECHNCIKLGQRCEGYGLRLLFDVDDDRNQRRVDADGNYRVAFVGKPRLKLTKKRRHQLTAVSANGGSAALLYDNLDSLLDLPDLERMLAMDPVVQLPPNVELPLPPELAVPPPPALSPPMPVPAPVYQEPPRPMPLPAPPILISETTPETSIETSTDTTPETTDETTLTQEEEAAALRHFFDTLLPMLDSNPELPWPQLALKYCDFDLARLCLMALAAVHMYELGACTYQFYRKGLANMDRVMRCLVTTIHRQTTTTTGESESETDDETLKALVMLFVILVLIHVHVIFACMETGQLALSRYLFQVFGVICDSPQFRAQVAQDPRKVAMMGYLLVYDTVALVVSPDARVPYCHPQWFGDINTDLSTLSLMGCPGEVWRCIHRICHLRHATRAGASGASAVDISAEVAPLHHQLLQYRDYVPPGRDHGVAVSAARCWLLAGLAALARVAQHLASAYVDEFIMVYGLLDGTSRVVTQMVWPIHVMCVSSVTEHQRQLMMAFLRFQRQFTQMKQYTLMQLIVSEVWATGADVDVVTAKFVPPGHDYLCI